MKKAKLLLKILSGSKNVGFKEFVSLVEAFGFYLSRAKGSHHIFRKDGIPAMINIQNVKGKAKPYQIKQFIKIVEKYNLKLK